MIRPIHWGEVLALLALSAAAGFCQVKVTVKLDQPAYLAGEPVFAVIDVTNIGTERLSYWGGNTHLDLAVEGGRKKQAANLRGCYGGSAAAGSGGAVYDAPPLLPGQTASSRYLLKGYRLEPGDYNLRASGKAPVQWYFGWGRSSSPVSGRTVGAPVEGAAFDVSLRLSVRRGTEEELKQRYARHVLEAIQGPAFTERWRLAREAIAEMAPPFLEKTILSFADQPETADLAVEGLGQIPTAASRADLVQLYDTSADLRLRGLLVEKLAGIATREELPFLSSLLSGHSSALDDRIHAYAALGIGRVGGDGAARALASAPLSPNWEVRDAIVIALGNTQSAAAVPILIDMYGDAHDLIRNEVGLALATLTHYQWSYGATVTETQARWRQWWSAHGAHLTLYGMDQCVRLPELLPLASANTRE